MDGANSHGDVTRFFPEAETVTCDGLGGWATIEFGNGSVSTAECPVCICERGVAALERFTPPRFTAPIDVPEAVSAWAKRGTEAQGLYLTGQVGTGKTHTAWAALAAWCQAANVYPRQDRPTIIFTRMTDLLDDLRPGDESRQRIRDCQRAALLVIDDLGAEKASEWTQERFYSIVDERYANCLPLIVTSNLPPKQLGGQVGERAASRLQEMCEIVPMTGTDRRKPAA